jgi:hypothetical protein
MRSGTNFKPESSWFMFAIYLLQLGSSQGTNGSSGKCLTASLEVFVILCTARDDDDYDIFPPADRSKSSGESKESPVSAWSPFTPGNGRTVSDVVGCVKYSPR